MRKKTCVLLISFLSATAIAFGTVAVVNTNRARKLEYTMRAYNECSFTNLVAGMSDLSDALEKCRYIEDPALQCALSAEIFGSAVKAQLAMSNLPYSSEQIEQAAGFLRKVGDYALVLSKKTGRGTAITEDEREVMNQLSEVASVLAGNLDDLQMQLGNGTLLMDTVYTRKSSFGDDTPLLSESISSMETEFPELPVLIYDGPFSDAIQRDEPQFLKNMKDVDEQEAAQIAAKMLQIEESALSLNGESRGDVPCWCFRAAMSGGEYTVYITKCGGVLYSVLSSRTVGTESLSTEEALKIASDLLEKMGFDAMDPSYYVLQNGVLVVDFEYMDGNIRCYPDLIKIGIAMDSGILQSFEASGYIQAHKEREFPTDLLSTEEAASVLGANTNVVSSSLAMIPLDGGEEELCYEFLCESDTEQRSLIYVDAQKGTEERILLLIEDDKGSLTV